LSENVHDFAKDVFKLDETLYKPWATHICSLLKESKHKLAISEINKLGSKKIAIGKLNLINYILNNENNIDYARYLDNGWYIGSGAIESANKTVLQQRLKQAGMRWNKETGQYVLSLMAKAKSNLWKQDVVNYVEKHFDFKRVYEHIENPLTFKLK
jgi:hypothetical protein